MITGILTFFGALLALMIAIPCIIVMVIVNAIRERRERKEREHLAREAEYQRWAEQAREKDRLEKVRLAFEAFPSWPSGVHEEDFQRRKIDRAFDDKSMYIIDYHPATQTAHVCGSRGIVYAVSPYKCECPSFQKNYNSIFYNYRTNYQLYPCKHIYILVLALSYGFTSFVKVVSEYQMISDEEKKQIHERSIRKLAIEGEPLHHDIIQYLQNHEPVTIATLKKEFSSIPPNEVTGAVYKLVSIGSILRLRNADSPSRRCVYTVK